MLAFEILGPLVVRGDDGEIAISGARRRALLVRLLIAANELVPAGPLAEDLWEGDPPAGAVATLQSHISQLRKSLDPGRLVGRHGGYVLEVGPDELDVWRFEEESRQGREALVAGDPGAAAGLLATALGRWRGQALADVSGTSWARPEQTRLEELHLGAIETWLEARLELGQHQEVVASAEAAIVDHPLREGIWGYLMLALYRSGRQSDALRAYQRVRTLLGEELGIEPSAPLVALDAAIVQQKPELEWLVTEAAQGNAWTAVDAASNVAQRAVPGLPSGTVTLLSTDIEESTQIWEAHPESMGIALRRHDELIRSHLEDAGGFVFKATGGEFCAAFGSATQALEAAIDAQRSLEAEPWPEGARLRVRMALHTGECEVRNGDYVGPTFNRTTRLVAVAHGGQIVVSGATADMVRDYLPAGVGLRHLGTHRLKDLGRPEEVFQLEIEGLDAQFPPLRSLDDPDLLHNLPELVSSFVGRDAEVAEVRTMVEESRLVTLTGPGGVGKTRLALQVGAELLDGSGDGVWLVGLAAVGEPEEVTGAVAKALGIKEQGGLPTPDALVTALADRNILIVLDNCEHLIGACAKLAEAVVRGCPQVHLLATSREALGIDGERIFRVPSLTVPAEDAQEVAEVAASGAVTMFVERARSQATDFTLTEEAAPLVAAVCRRLDGMPLAIELAAARLRSMSLSHLHDRLDQRFRLLTGGSRTALPRQQTLRAMVDWSYDLLNDVEQAVLRRLSVFVGGFDLEAAEAVCGFGDVEGFDVAVLLGSLVDKSLVVAEPHGSTVRYRMQETLRQYGVERLSETAAGERPEAERLADAHSDYYLGLAEHAAPHMVGPSRRSWTRRLATEDMNLRAAIEHAVATPAGSDRVLRQFWTLQNYWKDAHQPAQILALVDQALERLGPDLAPGRRGQGLYCKVRLLFHVDRRLIIETVLTTLDLAREAGDRALEAGALSHYCRFQDGADPGRLDAGPEAVALARQCGDNMLLGNVLYNYATALHIAEDSRAEALYLEGLAFVEQSGDEDNAMGLHNNYGVLLKYRGDLASARHHFEVALDLAGVDVPNASVMITMNLAWILLEEGHIQRAEVQLMDSLRSCRRLGNLSLFPDAVLALARCAIHSDEHDRAAKLHGGADALNVATSSEWNPGQAKARETDIAVLRDRLGADFERHYEAGLAMTHDDIIKLALRRS